VNGVFGAGDAAFVNTDSGNAAIRARLAGIAIGFAAALLSALREWRICFTQPRLPRTMPCGVLL
jgi:hypothetical protein